MVWFLRSCDGHPNGPLCRPIEIIPSGVIQIGRYVTGLSHDFAAIAIYEQHGQITAARSQTLKRLLVTGEGALESGHCFVLLNI